MEATFSRLPAKLGLVLAACLACSMGDARGEAASLNLRRGESHRGLHFVNDHLSIRPFVNLEFMYDSNVDYDRREYDDCTFSVNPGVDLDYVGNNWGLRGSGWYGHEWYKEYDELDSDRYGESLKFNMESEKGWRLLLGESYQRTRENDSIVDGGRGIWRDREILEFTGALSYDISERTSVTLSGMYSDLDYRRDQRKYAPLYGWDEWSAQLELARKLTEKSNFLLVGGVQSYRSDGATSGVNNQSMGYTLMAGLGSRASEKISYRLLTGVSLFDYANDDQQAGWTYSVDTSWVINKYLGFTLAGSSYFQPSEREQNQSVQVYTLSSGLTYRPYAKLTTNFDLAFRHEENEYNYYRYRSEDRDDTFSARVRANYQLMRTKHLCADLYAMLEYDRRFSDASYYEFDAFRAVAGVRLFY